MHKNGCYDRPPFAEYNTLSDGRQINNFTYHRDKCEYTKSELGQADKSCVGCVWRLNKGSA